MKVVTDRPPLQQCPGGIQSGGDHGVGASFLVPGVPKGPPLGSGFNAEAVAAGQIVGLLGLVVTRRDQSSATEVKEWPFLDAAITLDMQVPDMAGQLVHRLVHSGGVVGIGSVRLPALALRRRHDIAGKQFARLPIHLARVAVSASSALDSYARLSARSCTRSSADVHGQ
jgi:hypothetical protein